MIFLAQEARARLYSAEFRASLPDQTHDVVRAAFEGAGAGTGNADWPHNSDHHHDRLDSQMRCDLRFYLPEDILPKVDAMSMATSLEARVPYLDNEVLDLALAIPSHLKVRRGVRKWILREAFAGRLPEQILRRGKEGFSMPMKNWLNGDWNSLMHDLLSARNLARDGLFDAGFVDTLIRQHEARTHNHSHLLWGLMVFQLWRDRFASDVRHSGARVHAA
jgi:asparagine synthase (glutamine-hydrolysing)